MVTILIIRHAQTDHNKLKILQGHTNTSLNQAGLLQAQQLGAFLAQEGVKVDAAWSSDLERCRETTEAVLAAVEKTEGTKIKRVYTKECRERGLGPLEGMRWEDAQVMAKAEGKQMADYGEVSTFLFVFTILSTPTHTHTHKCPVLYTYISAQRSRLTNQLIKPRSEVTKRVATLWPHLLQTSHLHDWDTVLLVSHGGYISCLMRYLLGGGHAVLGPDVPADSVGHPRNTSVTTVEVPRGSKKGVVVSYGEVRHLEKEAGGGVNFEDGQE